MRRSQELPESPIDALTDYFNSNSNQKTSELDLLNEQVEKLKVENKILEDEIEQTIEEIEKKKIEKEQEEEAKRLEEEELAKKNPKKGAALAKKK